jgi:ANTAR domain
MTGSRQVRVWGLVAATAASRGRPVSAADACAAVVAAAGVSGAWLNATADGDAGHLMEVTGGTGEVLAELELTLGEGPSRDAIDSGGPVLVSDLSTVETAQRWPGFAPAALLVGVSAVFAFPLRMGAIRAGVMALYRDRPGPLSAFQLGDALVFADTATLLLIEARDLTAGDGRPGPGGQPEDLAAHRAEIDQATGMLTEQLGVSIADAFIRLRAYAYARDLRLGDVARDIVARRLRLRPDSCPSLGGEA